MMACGVVTDLVIVDVEMALRLGEIGMAGIVWIGCIITRCVENMFSF